MQIRPREQSCDVLRQRCHNCGKINDAICHTRPTMSGVNAALIGAERRYCRRSPNFSRPEPHENNSRTCDVGLQYVWWLLTCQTTSAYRAWLSSQENTVVIHAAASSLKSTGPKKQGHRLMAIILSNLNRLKNSLEYSSVILQLNGF